MTEPRENPFAGEMNNFATLVFGLAQPTNHIDHPRVGPDVPIIEMRFRIEDDGYAGHSTCFQQTLVDMRYVAQLKAFESWLDRGWCSFTSSTHAAGPYGEATSQEFVNQVRMQLALHVGSILTELLKQPIMATLTTVGVYPQRAEWAFAPEVETVEG